MPDCPICESPMVVDLDDGIRISRRCRNKHYIFQQDGLGAKVTIDGGIYLVRKSWEETAQEAAWKDIGNAMIKARLAWAHVPDPIPFEWVGPQGTKQLNTELLHQFDPFLQQLTKQDGFVSVKVIFENQWYVLRRIHLNGDDSDYNS